MCERSGFGVGFSLLSWPGAYTKKNLWHIGQIIHRSDSMRNTELLVSGEERHCFCFNGLVAVH